MCTCTLGRSSLLPVVPHSAAGSTFEIFVTALQRQSALRDSIDRITTQIRGLEQLLTLTVVTLPPNTPQTTAFTQQLAGEIKSRKDRKNEMVQTYNQHTYLEYHSYLRKLRCKSWTGWSRRNLAEVMVPL